MYRLTIIGSFSLRPSHSVIEFQRCLRKHLPDIHLLNDVKTLDRTRYNLYESIILPISTHLRSKGVNFHFNAKVVDIRFDIDGKSSEPTTINGIILRENEEERIVNLNPNDFAIVTVGSPHSSHQVGNNLDPPPQPSVPNDFSYEDWSLWIHLAQKSTKFGVPLNFNSHPQESTLVTFTVTLHDSEFMRLYRVMTHDVPGSGALLSFPDSNWLLSISVPHQPVCSNQPPNTHIIWGYGLQPERIGNFVDKPMTKCAGREIMVELLSHLDFPIKSLLPESITIPCLFPLGTSALLPRYPKNRPEVIPPKTTNIALVGIFAEIPHDTTFNLEYIVRGAQTAVYQLMGLPKSPPKTKRNLLLDVFDLLVEG
jgi:oleate hydratase